MTMKNPCHPGRIVREAITEGLGLTVTAAAKGLGERAWAYLARRSRRS